MAQGEELAVSSIGSKISEATKKQNAQNSNQYY